MLSPNAKTLTSLFLILVVAGTTPLILPASYNPYITIPYACAQGSDMYPLNGPRVDEIIFKYYASRDAEIAALQRGEIETIQDIVRTADIDTLSKDPNIQLTFNLQTHYCYAAFNLRRDTVNEINLRKAIAHLIPREDLANKLFGGTIVTPMLYEVLPSFGKWHNPNVKTYPFNVDTAKQILASAGYQLNAADPSQTLDPSGKPMRQVSFVSPTQEEAPTSFELVRIVTDQMRAIGINVVHEAIAFDALLTRVYTDHDFDIYFLCVSGLGKYPRWIYDFYHSSLDVPDGDNSPGVHNDELDRLLTQFRYEDQTEDAAVQHIWRAQEIIADTVARTPIYSRYQIEATRKGWEGQIVTRGGGFFPPGGWSYVTVHKAGQQFGGTFAADVGGRVRTLSPMFDTGAYDQRIWNLIYEALIFSNPDGDIIPGLAASWETQDITTSDGTPGTKITYHLNQNVSWHDGTKFTSKDVKFTYDFVVQNQIPIWLANVESVESVDAPDDYTVVITVKSRGFFSFLDTSSVAMVPQHIWSGVGSNWRTFVPSQEAHPSVAGLTKEIGTGPFILTEFTPNEFWRMAWNPLYFKRHPDKTFQVERTNVPESLTQGDASQLQVTVKSYTGEVITDAAVTADLVVGGTTVSTLTFSHVGNGVYQASLDTANLQPGAYSIVLKISRGTGALAQSATLNYALDLAAPFPLIPVAIVVIVVLIAAGYVVIRRRGKQAKT